MNFIYAIQFESGIEGHSLKPKKEGRGERPSFRCEIPHKLWSVANSTYLCLEESCQPRETASMKLPPSKTHTRKIHVPMKHMTA